MKKVIVSVFALVMFATVSHAQDVKKSGTATPTQQAAPANSNTQPQAQQPAQPQSDNNAQTASNASKEVKQPNAADKKTNNTPQAK